MPLKKKEKNKDFEPDFKLEPWADVFAGKIPLKAHVHRVDDIFTAIRIAREFNLKLTLDHCSEGHLIAEKIAESGYPAIVGPDLSSRNKIEVQNVAFKTAGILKKAGVLIPLSKTELQLLIFLLDNAGHILSKESILEKVWGLDGQFVDDNTVTVNISRLKNKLETDRIENVRGLGYLWTEKVNKK